MAQTPLPFQNIFGNEIVSTANVTINANGTWNMGGNSESCRVQCHTEWQCHDRLCWIGVLVGTTITANPGFWRVVVFRGSGVIRRRATLQFCGQWRFLDGSLVVSATVAGTAVINKTGNGFLDFSGPNTFNSQLNVLAGTLGVGEDAGIGVSEFQHDGQQFGEPRYLFVGTNNSLVVASTGSEFKTPAEPIRYSSRI